MKRFVLVLAILVVSSCAVFESKTVNLSKEHTGEAVESGEMMYFLPTGRIHLTLDSYSDASVDIKLETTYIPDITKACFLRYRESSLSYDKIQVGLSGGVFLSSISSETEDNTPKIVSDFGTIAANTLKLAAKLGAGGAAEAKVLKLHVDRIIDPFNPRDVADLNAQVGRIGMKLKVNSDFDGDAESMSQARDEPSGKPSGWGFTPEGGERYEGLFYRPALPYRLNFITDPTTAGETTYGQVVDPAARPPAGIVSYNVNLPNEAPIMEIKVSRAAFVKNSVKINFDNGMLKDISYDKPSQIEGFVQIPVDLSKQALAIPNDLLTIRYANVTNQTTTLGDQTALLKAQADLIAAQQALKTAQENAKPSPTPSSTPSPMPSHAAASSPAGCPGPGCP